ncbi:baculoviral IAP repeat-containing protein 5.1-like [Podarcis muralis]
METVLHKVNSNSKCLLEYRSMHYYENRLSSFACWPFKENCKCTPESMARAGLIHCPGANEPDLAKCFFCLIELEGWEPDHDPWLEHSKRAGDSCGFLSLSKSFDDLTVEEYYELEMERVRIFLSKTGQSVINAYEKEVAATRQRLVDHFVNKYQYAPEPDPATPAATENDMPTTT